jgi:cytidyltransferase-like protein
MFINDLFEDDNPRRVVTYPGRFQPFHQGHADVFRSLQAKFGENNVFIVTANKTNDTDSPFNFSDKVRFMHAAGIPDHSIIEASKVYDLPDQFHGQKSNLVFITALGAPDAKRLNPGSIKKNGEPSYFQTMPEDAGQMSPADQHGYVVIANERERKIDINGQPRDVSHGTQVRDLWNEIRGDQEARRQFLMQLYGRADPDLAHILDKIPHTVSEDGGVGVVRAGDRRYSNALTVDVRPDTLGKEMKAYGLVGRESPAGRQQKVDKNVGKGVKEQQLIRRMMEIKEQLDQLKPKLAKYKKRQISEMTAGGTGAGAVSTAPMPGAGTLFGGSYQRKNNPFAAPAKKKKAKRK